MQGFQRGIEPQKQRLSLSVAALPFFLIYGCEQQLLIISSRVTLQDSQDPALHEAWLKDLLWSMRNPGKEVAMLMRPMWQQLRTTSWRWRQLLNNSVHNLNEVGSSFFHINFEVSTVYFYLCIYLLIVKPRSRSLPKTNKVIESHIKKQRVFVPIKVLTQTRCVSNTWYNQRALSSVGVAVLT